MANYLPTTVDPVRATKPNSNARVLVAPFGDGYQQRAADGINNVVQTWSVEWSALQETESNELISFFEDMAGWQSFLWTPPGDSREKKFTCKTWGESHPGDSQKNISAQFEEVFDL